MSSIVEYNPELRIVQVKYVGRITGDELRKTTIEVLDLAKANSTTLFLIDVSELENVASIFDVYELPKLYGELDADGDSKIALIMPAPDTAAAKDARFYETVCLNRGWQVKVFSERQEAINSLTNKNPSNRADTSEGL